MDNNNFSYKLIKAGDDEKIWWLGKIQKCNLCGAEYLFGRNIKNVSWVDIYSDGHIEYQCDCCGYNNVVTND